MDNFKEQEPANLGSLSDEMLQFAQNNGTNSHLLQQMFIFIGEVQKTQNDLLVSEGEFPERRRSHFKKLNELAQEVSESCFSFIPEQLS